MKTLFLRSARLFYPLRLMSATGILVLVFAPMTIAWAADAGKTGAPSDDQGAYATRRYRNFFVEQGHTAGEVSARIRIQAFFAGEGLDKYGDLYSLDGKQVSSRHSTGLVATNAVASLAATNPRAKDFVKALWGTPAPSGEQRYYDGMLYLMSMMHLSGEFRIWAPK